MTLGRCPLSIFCSRDTPPREVGAHALVNVMNENLLIQPTRSLSTITIWADAGGHGWGVALAVGGGVRIHPENARMSGRHGVQYVAQCVACAALTPVVWQ